MIQLKSFDLAFHFSFNQNKLWTNWRSNRALLCNKPSILYQTVDLVETNVFPDRIDFYRICPLDRHVWESLLYTSKSLMIRYSLRFIPYTVRQYTIYTVSVNSIWNLLTPFALASYVIYWHCIYRITLCRSLRTLFILYQEGWQRNFNSKSYIL